MSTKIKVSKVELVGNDVIRLWIINEGSITIEGFNVRVIGSNGVDVKKIEQELKELDSVTEEINFDLDKTGNVEKVEVVPIVSSSMVMSAIIIKDLPSVFLKAKLFLQGAYEKDIHEMRVVLNDQGVIPLTSPYQEDPRTVTAMPQDVTDRVLVQLRESYNGLEMVSKSVFLRKDGMLVADDGLSTVISIRGINPGFYYLIVRHRNHLVVMSSDPLELNGITPIKFDFSEGIGEYSEEFELEQGVWGLYASDMNHDEVLTTDDYASWYSDARQGKSGYVLTDANLDGEVTIDDYTLWYNNARKVSQSSVPTSL